MTKKELRQTLKRILQNTPVFTELSPIQVTLVQTLIKEEIRTILIIQKGTKKLFRFLFKNNSFKDTGVTKLFEAQKDFVTRNKNKFTRDCRKVIQPQIKKYYQNMIASGKVTPLGEKPHVDHLYPFSYLLKDFCLDNKISYFDLVIDSDNYKELLRNFADYHSKKAKLKIISKTENLKKSNKLI